MKKPVAGYGMLAALIGLCFLFSVMTLQKESASGVGASRAVIKEISSRKLEDGVIIVAGEARRESGEFAERTARLLHERGIENVSPIVGAPRDLKLELDRLQAEGRDLKVLIAAGDVSTWGVTTKLQTNYPEFAMAEVIIPPSRWRSGFLSKSNFVAIASRVVAIAVVAVGMTLVILTGGIDLSVGSLIALSAVIAAWIIRELGGDEALSIEVLAGFVGAILACGLTGALSGWLIAHFKVPPFITTLAFMMIARGAARKITGGFTIDALPDSMTWLGQGKLIGIPNTVWIMALLYLSAHLFMTQTRYGRYILAVGGNEEAARLSGVPVRRVLIFVYIICGLCAGLGGCIEASQIKVGSPNIGMMFELYVIAAVVVGGTSLSGGSGSVSGTLVGALMIAVIQNGMNLLGLKEFTQNIVLGLVILCAVLLDRARTASKKPIGVN